jgi:hypothetical protein
VRTGDCTTVRSPSRNTPSAGLERTRWQVSRLAEQGFAFPSIPAFPTLVGSVASGISPVTVAGAAASRGITLSHSLFACRRTGTNAAPTICLRA